jgi:hypothetical protein
MGGRLTKLSDTRWRYETGRRVYFVRQVKRATEDLSESGLFWVDGGAGHTGTLTADSIEQVADELREGQPIPRTDDEPYLLRTT